MADRQVRRDRCLRTGPGQIADCGGGGDALPSRRRAGRQAIALDGELLARTGGGVHRASAARPGPRRDVEAVRGQAVGRGQVAQDHQPEPRSGPTHAEPGVPEVASGCRRRSDGAGVAAGSPADDAAAERPPTRPAADLVGGATHTAGYAAAAPRSHVAVHVEHRGQGQRRRQSAVVMGDRSGPRRRPVLGVRGTAAVREGAQVGGLPGVQLGGAARHRGGARTARRVRLRLG